MFVLGLVWHHACAIRAPRYDLTRLRSRPHLPPPIELARSFKRSSTPSAIASASDAADATAAAALKSDACSAGFIVDRLRPLRPSLAFVNRPHYSDGDSSDLIRQPVTIERKVPQPSAKTRMTWGMTKEAKTHMIQKCHQRAQS